jgi:hypothetical protein
VTIDDQPQPEQQGLALEVLRAEHGDCLLLTHGQEIVLIDGGPAKVYDSALKPRLQELVGERGQPVWIGLIMVSHIDDDHIVGLADMFAEAREREEQNRGPAEWRAGELWFNAFGALTGANPTAGSSGVKGAALEALAASAPGSESRAVAVGVKNGIALHEDALALGLKFNESAGGGLVERVGDGPTIEVVPGLTFTVVSPARARLEKLQKKWEEWERDHPRAEAKKAENLDRSVFNLSSIAVLARSGERSLLLTGDARSDDLMEGLEALGLVTADGPPLEVDVLKLPHHGSIRNVDKRFFDRVRARHYVISANGRDGNPEDETLALICDSRPKEDDEPWTLWLTYGGEAGDGKPGLHERLEKFLDDRKRNEKEIDARFAGPGQRHTITL